MSPTCPHTARCSRALCGSGERCGPGAARGAARPGHKMAAAAEGGARPPEEAAGERSVMRPRESGGHSNFDTDSDETVVEGSVVESDVEEEEFRRKRG